MCHGLATIGEGKRRDGITATHHCRTSTGRDSTCYSNGPLAKRRHFEDTHRAVPDYSACGAQHLAKTHYGRHANIQTLPTGWNTLISDEARRGVGLDVLGNHVIARQETLYPVPRGFGENITGHGDTIRLDQGVTHGIALHL